jgi:hypothetical protein
MDVKPVGFAVPSQAEINPKISPQEAMGKGFFVAVAKMPSQPWEMALALI